MLVGRVWTGPAKCRLYSTAGQILRTVPTLPDDTLVTFQQQAFNPAIPALLPKGAFDDLPAVTKWFSHESSRPPVLNRSYLGRFGATLVPLELTHANQFSRMTHSLSFFLECTHAASSIPQPNKPSRYFTSHTPNARPSPPPNKHKLATKTFFNARPPPPPPPPPAPTSKPSPRTARIYLAQASLTDLPRQLRDDLPTPALVRHAGRGDLYDSSLWLGLAPTYTPLHRDPNPNLFVQLAGEKRVRLYPPEIGRGIYAEVRERIGARGGSASFRGEEMMGGVEKEVLEEVVWGRNGREGEVWEAVMGRGDGLFIPRGWWHSVKGTGKGMTGSVNWWFR